MTYAAELDPRLDEGFEGTGFNIVKAKLRAIKLFPSLASVIKRFRFKNDSSAHGGIAHTDAESYVAINASRFDRNDDNGQAAIVAHEAMHTEEKIFGKLGNLATDAVINAKIVLSGLMSSLSGFVDIPGAISMGSYKIHKILCEAWHYLQNPQIVPQQGLYDDPGGSFIDKSERDLTEEECYLACFGNYDLWDRMVAWIGRRKEKEHQEMLQHESTQVYNIDDYRRENYHDMAIA
ncbi:MAG: hypothetical protein FWE31_02130 [Firmicutes bacterium]|nr:hypothetical protein [Bacillota bacterium]